jgi:hypothetical protein
MNATDREAELSRRLEDLAATTTVDAEAWEKIQSRIAATSSRTRPTPWQLVAVAAALVVVLGAIVLTRRDDGSRVETGDDETTTTTDHDTSSTSDRDLTTTSTIESSDSPGVPPPGGQHRGL